MESIWKYQNFKNIWLKNFPLRNVSIRLRWDSTRWDFLMFYCPISSECHTESSQLLRDRVEFGLSLAVEFVFFFLIIFYWFQRERDEGRNISLLFCLFIHSLVDSCMFPDQGSNSQLWRIGTMLQPTEQSHQGILCVLNHYDALPQWGDSSISKYTKIHV